VIVDLVQHHSQAPTLPLLDSGGSGPICFKVQMYAITNFDLGQPKPRSKTTSLEVPV